MEAASLKARIVSELQAVKRRSGKTYGQIADETGLTNVYVAQLLRRQAQLKPSTAPLLRAALPALTDDLLLEMKQPPLRSYDPNLIQDPTVYRLNEAVMHFGESIKEIINEDFGDGINSKMNSGDFPNSNSPDGMPMFGGSGAQWPGHEVDGYRPFRVDTPGSAESNFDPNTQYNPNFTMDSYRLDDMEPTRKKKVKVKSRKLPEVEQNDEYAPRRQNYNDDETMVLTRSWIDILEDPVYSNNQRQVAHWERIAERYNELKPPASYKRKKEQLRKHWDRTKKEVIEFSAEYTKSMRMRGSGESLKDVCDKALMSYRSLYGVFKHYAIWAVVKDMPKFQGGITPAFSASKRTKNTASGDYMSSGGANPVDLNETLHKEKSYDTPVSTGRRRPTGINAAKSKGQGKATTSAPQAQAPMRDDPQLGDLIMIVRQRTLLDTHNALMECQDPVKARYLAKLIEQLQRQLRMD